MPFAASPNPANHLPLESHHQDIQQLVQQLWLTPQLIRDDVLNLPAGFDAKREGACHLTPSNRLRKLPELTDLLLRALVRGRCVASWFRVLKHL